MDLHGKYLSKHNISLVLYVLVQNSHRIHYVPLGGYQLSRSFRSVFVFTYSERPLVKRGFHGTSLQRFIYFLFSPYIHTYTNHNHNQRKKSECTFLTVSKLRPKNEFSLRDNNHVTKIFKKIQWNLLTKFGSN